VVVHNISSLNVCTGDADDQCFQMCVFVTLGRFTGSGWQSAEAVDMMTVYNSLPGADIQRLVLL